MPQAAGSPVLNAASEPSMPDELSALPAGEIRVFIHHSANHQRDAALAQRLADYLRGEGFTVADIRSVHYNIGMPSVRYFFARDRAASQRLVEELGRFSQGTSLAPDHASDFTHFLPKPRPGAVMTSPCSRSCCQRPRWAWSRRCGLTRTDRIEAEQRHQCPVVVPPQSL
jgi:hypothetical protein